MMRVDSFTGRSSELQTTELRQQEKEHVTKRQEKARVKERQEMGRILGINDESILLRLQQIGYSSETISLLYFVPAVLTAWAEGRLTRREHEFIFAVAEQRGIKPNSEAYLKLLEWLIESPGKTFLEQSMQAIRTILQNAPPDECETKQLEILHQCTQIAAVSGGLTGWLGLTSNVCAEEQQMLENIARQLTAIKEKNHEESETYQERKAA